MSREKVWVNLCIFVRYFPMSCEVGKGEQGLVGILSSNRSLQRRTRFCWHFVKQQTDERIEVLLTTREKKDARIIQMKVCETRGNVDARRWSASSELFANAAATVHRYLSQKRASEFVSCDVTVE
ncbi:hypothetical protein BHM03_00004710 [Ensete ventricosum]|uniref:Uncharacterized protein n=1 Tax=Ensete ventricosum TaxID=4639 RepID=A0A445MAQ7_ENSVE|nr:hypothetical protein BHM03_00004710 [Ensete ventricosum]